MPVPGFYEIVTDSKVTFPNPKFPNCRANTMKDMNCELCREPGGKMLWEDELCRIVMVEGPEGDAFPGFCRVIWKDHTAEMSDLPFEFQAHIMRLVFVTELALRTLVAPDKVNLASLGNKTPHLHWHVIPRWQDDSHFPAPIWATAQRPVVRRPRPSREEMHGTINDALIEFFKPDPSGQAQ